LKSKYRNIKTVVDGITFDSIKESVRYRQLMLLQRAGKIHHLELQARFDLDVNGMRICFYKADFVYNDESGRCVVEDVKGILTPVFRLKYKLMKAIHGIDIKIT